MEKSFGGGARENAVEVTKPLTNREKDILLDRMKRFRFDGYFRGGCAHHAHAALMLTNPSIQDRLQKVWALPAAGTQHIRLPTSVGAPVDVPFHVALAFANQRGETEIYDGCLAHGRFLYTTEWVQLFEANQNRITITEGNYWDYDGRSGEFVRYTPELHQKMILPKRIARDRTVSTGYICSRVEAMMSDPTALGTYLENAVGTSEEDGDCAGVVIGYRMARRHWNALLRPEQPLPPPSAA